VAPTRQQQEAALAGTVEAGRAGPGSLAGLGCRRKEKGRLGCLRRGREEVEGPPTDFAGLGCKSATTPAGRERGRARGAVLGQKEEKESGGRKRTFSNF
jgi:hypothetical protein